jgi:hypothetical protein
MCEVWRAHDTDTDRIVAIKVLPAHFSDNEDFKQRFRREAHAAARLNTPHVIPIHHYGEIDAGAEERDWTMNQISENRPGLKKRLLELAKMADSRRGAGAACTARHRNPVGDGSGAGAAGRHGKPDVPLYTVRGPTACRPGL